MSSVVTLVNEIETKVENSAQLLDSARPGWFRDIDLDDFDIQDCQSCVLGQLYGGYMEGTRALHVGFVSQVDRGLLFWEHDDDQEGLTNAAWRRAIQHRLATAA